MSYTVNGLSCSYTRLRDYNSTHSKSAKGAQNTLGGARHVRSVIPGYSAAGYNVLTNGFTERSCGGYFLNNNAYGCKSSYSPSVGADSSGLGADIGSDSDPDSGCTCDCT